MCRLTALLLSLLISLPALAERKQSFAEVDVHYSVFNSSFLQPDIASAVGLVRSKTQGVVTVSVLKAGKPLPAQVKGEVKNLLGQVTPLSFKQVTEPGAAYYLAQFPLSTREILTFTLDIQGGDGSNNRVSFNQEVFPDE